MPNNLVSFRVEEDKIKEANEICDRLGLDLPSYLRLCISRLIKEDGIPFSMKGNKAANPASTKTSGSATVDSSKTSLAMAEEEAIAHLDAFVASASKYHAEIIAKRAISSYRYHSIEITFSKPLKQSMMRLIIDDAQNRIYGTPISASFEGNTLIVQTPRTQPKTLTREELLANHPSLRHRPMHVALGVDKEGRTAAIDIRRSSNMLVGGSTGSGKSILLHSIVMDLIEKNDPTSLRLILVDPKRVEFSLYKDIPNLLCPIIKDVMLVRPCVVKLINEMENRMNIFREANVSNIVQYNEIYAKQNGLDKLPYIILFIDEYADVAMSDPSISKVLLRLLQKSRAAGIITILSTQRPQLDVINSALSLNIGTRIALYLSRSIDSLVTLGEPGGESLLGHGDMLVKSPELSKTKAVRLQAAYIPPKDVIELASRLKNACETVFDPEFLDLHPLPTEAEIQSEEVYSKIVEAISTMDFISISKIQRLFNIGFPRAVKIMKRLIDEGKVEDNSNQKDPRGNRVIHLN